jgi:hypothetical protein
MTGTRIVRPRLVRVFAAAATALATLLGGGKARGTPFDPCPGAAPACSAGTYSATGYAPPDPMFCWGACTKCPDGQYQQNTGQKSCKPCGTGCMGCDPKNGVCGSCSSNYSLNSGNCIPTSCKAGSFSATGLAPCTSCPAGQFQPSVGAKSCNACSPVCSSCDAVYGSCRSCNPGFAFSTTGGGSCVACSPGTYWSGYGAAVCTSCPYKTGGCAGDPGYSGSGPSPAPCGGCSACAPTNGFCTSCPAGKEPNKQSCSPCAAGTYKGSAGGGKCVSCPLGHCSTAGAIACTPCPTVKGTPAPTVAPIKPSMPK